MNLQYKVVETDTGIYFLTGPLSQWHYGVFYGRLTPDDPVLRFTHREQYMMAGKAILFNDNQGFKKIMEAKTPDVHKALGREVGNFDAKIWNANCREIVFRGNWFTCEFCAEYRDVLLNSGDKILVEGNPKNKIWGVGLSWADPAILDPANWKGANYLGEAHMEVRQCYRRLLAHRRDAGDPTATFNVWTRKIETNR